MKFTFIIPIYLLVSHLVFAQSTTRGNAKSVIITPPLELKYTLGGYGARMSKPAEGIHDDIKAKALVLDDGKKKMAVVTMDIVGFPPNVRPLVAQRLAGTGWTLDNILLLPSHSHSSLEMSAINNKNVFGMPAIGIFQPKLLAFVVKELAKLIKETDQGLVPLKVGTGQVILEGLNRNRRGDETIDKELTVTRIDKMDGKPLAVLVNWTAHPTIMDEHDMWVSGGWPGYLQRELEDWIGEDVVAMYYNGAEGDQSVVTSMGNSHYERAEYYGRRIAKETLDLYRKIEVSKEVSFNFNSQKIALPPRVPHPSFMETGGEEYQLSEEKVQVLLNQLFPATTYITAFSLGELMIVGAPGEMIAELGVSIKASLKDQGFKYPVIGGLANEWISYILTESEYKQGGYETSVSFYGPTLGEEVQREMLRTANLLKD